MPINENELKARIEYARNLADYSKTDLAKLLEMSMSTFQRRMDNPMSMTIEEFYRLNEVLANEVLAEYLQEELNIKVVKKIHRRRKQQIN